MIFQMLDGIPFKLKAPIDFSFLSVYGRVFKIFDDQDSGNICFGCEKDGQKVFRKKGLRFCAALAEYQAKYVNQCNQL